MKKLLYLTALFAFIFTACKKEEDTATISSTGVVSGIKDGTFSVNGSVVTPNQILFTGGNLEARTSGSVTLNDIIIEIGTSFETKIYPLSNKTITDSILRIEYQTGTSGIPIIWYSTSGNVSITDNTTSVTADFKDVVFTQTNDANKTTTISAYLTAKL